MPQQSRSAIRQDIHHNPLGVWIITICWGGAALIAVATGQWWILIILGVVMVWAGIELARAG